METGVDLAQRDQPHSVGIDYCVVMSPGSLGTSLQEGKCLCSYYQ